MPHEEIDPRRIETRPLSEREDLIDIRTAAADPDAPPPDAGDLRGAIERMAEAIAVARRRGAAVILAYGAHLVKNGGGPVVNRLVAGGWLTHLATHGAGIIHDWEFAYRGTSSESVAENAPAGRFGHWEETGRTINLAVAAGAARGVGFGESMGRAITGDGVELPDPGELARLVAENPSHPLTGARADLLEMMTRFGLAAGRHEIAHSFKDFSIPAACYRRGVPLTVHPGIGYDIYNVHPFFCGAAVGRAAATDLRILTRAVRDLAGGVYLSVGSAVMSPQVFEKTFSAANNLRRGDGLPLIADHAVFVVDIHDGGGWDWSAGEPPKDNPAYYLRFCKSFFRLGASTRYVRGDNVTVLHNLLALLERGAPPADTDANAHSR